MYGLPKPFLCQMLKCERHWKSLLGDLQPDGSMLSRALQGGAAEVWCESLETGRALRTAGRFSELPASAVEVDAAADEGPVPGPVSAVWGTSTTPEHEGHRIFLPATLSGTFNVFLQWAH